MSYSEKIIDVSIDEEIIRPYTKQEIDEVEKAILETQSISEIEANKAAEKAALLAKLGITADEAKLLLA